MILATLPDHLDHGGVSLSAFSASFLTSPGEGVRPFIRNSARSSRAESTRFSPDRPNAVDQGICLLASIGVSAARLSQLGGARPGLPPREG